MAEKRKMKNNAGLEWDACFLKCNRIAVAEVLPDVGVGWKSRIYDSESTYWHSDQISARRHINQRFGLPLDFGEAKS